MNKEDIKIPVWKTKSEKGTEYFRGLKSGVEIEGKKYKVSLFINNEKQSDKSPDMTMILKEIKEEKQEKVEIPQNTKTEYSTDKSDVELTDADLPF